MSGTIVSGILVLYERTFDLLLVLPAVSENAPVNTEIVTTPVDTDGVTVKVYPVALSAVNPVAVALTSDTSLSMNPLAASVVVAVTEVAQVIVLTSEDERMIHGLVVSSIPVNTIPDATTGVAILPEYMIPLKESSPSCHPLPLKFKSNEPLDSPPIMD